MPKLKTHSGTKDRVRITKTGKVIRGRAFGGHNLSKKSAGRKRVIARSATITGRTLKNVKMQLGAE